MTEFGDGDSAAEPKTGSSLGFSQLFKLAVPLIILFFVGRAIYGNWAQIREEQWRLDWPYLLLSFVVSISWYLSRPYGWMVVINGFGNKVPFGEVYRIYRKSELSRYIPGAVWQLVARVYLTRRYGVKPSACLAATLVDIVLAALATFVPAVLVIEGALPNMPAYQRWVLMCFPVAALAVIHPKVLNIWVGAIAGWMKQPYSPLDIGFRTIVWVWTMYVAGSLGLAFGMAFFARALLPAAEGHTMYIAGSYGLAWVSALLTVISPGGMGIREGILGLLLGRVLASGTGLAVAVAMRVWLVAMELSWWLAGRWFPRAAEDPANPPA